MASKTDFDDSLLKTKFALLVSGIDVFNGKKTMIIKLMAYLFHINLLWLYTDVLGELFWLVEGIKVGKSFDELSIIAPCTTICLLATAKTAPLYFNKINILTIIERLRDIFLENGKKRSTIGERSANGTFQEKEIKASTIAILNKLTMFMCVSNNIVIISFCFLPLLSMWFDYKESGIVKLKLPFLVNYILFDPFTKPAWPFVYLHQIWSTFVVCFNIFGADTLFHAFCLYLRMHFDILCHRFENVVVESTRETKAGLRRCIVQHQKLIKLVSDIEKLYSKSTLFNIIVSSVLICLSGFNIAFIHDLGAVVAFSSFLLMSSYQIFMMCLFGDMILSSSKKVSEAVYRSRWYEAEPSIQNDIFIIILRSQKPCSVTAENFATLNLTAFTTILSRSWSYFALLKSMYK